MKLIKFMWLLPNVQFLIAVDQYLYLLQTIQLEISTNIILVSITTNPIRLKNIISTSYFSNKNIKFP